MKNLPMASGGAVTLGSGERAARLRRLRGAGVAEDTFERMQGTSYAWDYAVTEVGLRAQMNDVNAALGLVQLALLDDDNARRAAIATRYRLGLGGAGGIELLRSDGDRASSHHLFCVLADRRDDLVRRLGDHGVDVGVHYRPSYEYPMYEGPLPGVEAFWRRAVSLPMHLELEDEDVDRIVGLVGEGW